MGTNYSLTVNNNSKNYGHICVFQTMPDQPDNLLSLAWFSEPAHPGTSVTFDWNTDYSFVWSNQGTLKPGVNFKASQTLYADPSNISSNSIKFTKQFDAYRFTKANNNTKAGKLAIYTDETVPHGEASVGIGMSGSGTFAVTATPNYNFTFSPHPKYWVAFGVFKAGDVIDIESMTNIVEIKYATDVYDKVVDLKEDNTWEIIR